MPQISDEMIEAAAKAMAETPPDERYEERDGKMILVRDFRQTAFAALEAALTPSAGEAEPVAWLAEGSGWGRVFIDKEAAEKLAAQDGTLKPLYTRPSPSASEVQVRVKTLPERAPYEVLQVLGREYKTTGEMWSAIRLAISALSTPEQGETEAGGSQTLVTHIRPAAESDSACYAWQVCATGDDGAVAVYQSVGEDFAHAASPSTQTLATLEKLERVLTFPVSIEINPRGYNIRTEKGAAEYAVELIKEALAAPSQPCAEGVTYERIERLMHAVEGECDGLAIDAGQATTILAYALTGEAPPEPFAFRSSQPQSPTPTPPSPSPSTPSPRKETER